MSSRTVGGVGGTTVCFPTWQKKKVLYPPPHQSVKGKGKGKGKKCSFFYPRHVNGKTRKKKKEVASKSSPALPLEKRSAFHSHFPSVMWYRYCFFLWCPSFPTFFHTYRKRPGVMMLDGRKEEGRRKRRARW